MIPTCSYRAIAHWHEAARTCFLRLSTLETEAGSYASSWREALQRLVVLVLTSRCDLMISTKDRKDIVKVLKPYIATMAKDEDAQLILFTAFDVIEYVESLSHHPVTNFLQ